MLQWLCSQVLSLFTLKILILCFPRLRLTFKFQAFRSRVQFIAYSSVECNSLMFLQLCPKALKHTCYVDQLISILHNVCEHYKQLVSKQFLMMEQFQQTFMRAYWVPGSEDGKRVETGLWWGWMGMQGCRGEVRKLTKHRTCFQKVFTVPWGMEEKVEEKDSAVGMLTIVFWQYKLAASNFQIAEPSFYKIRNPGFSCTDWGAKEISSCVSPTPLGPVTVLLPNQKGDQLQV